MTTDCVPPEISAPDAEALSLLVRPTGLIPGTSTTPDIFFADNPEAAQVALTSYLVISHLDPRLQAYVSAHLDRVICAFSPQSEGRSMEACFVKNPTYPMTQRLPGRKYRNEGADKKTIGRFFNQTNGIAVYAVTDEMDDHTGWSTARRAQAHRQRTWRQAVIGENERLYTFVSDNGEAEAPFRELLDVLDLPDTPDLLTDMLCHIADSKMCGKIPLTLSHELGHFFEPLILDVIGSKGTEITYPSSLIQEIRENIPPGCPDFDYFRNPREALAELLGCAILERIKEKTRCNISFQTDGLEVALPKSYKLAKYALSQISRDAEPLQHYQPCIAAP